MQVELYVYTLDCLINYWNKISVYLFIYKSKASISNRSILIYLFPWTLIWNKSWYLTINILCMLDFDNCLGIMYAEFEQKYFWYAVFGLQKVGKRVYADLGYPPSIPEWMSKYHGSSPYILLCFTTIMTWNFNRRRQGTPFDNISRQICSLVV